MPLDSKTGRLSTDTRPVAYDLSIRVSPDEDFFEGRVRITVELARPQTEITLHALDLTILSAKVAPVGKPEDGKSAETELDPPTETLTLNPGTTIPAGKSILEISFSGTLNRQMKGLYLAQAKHRGTEERYAFTHFEPTDARRMFPCFDEPAFKAPFRVSVTAQEGFVVLSNMPARDERYGGKLKTVTFEETPVMSTYLLAIAVGRLESKSRIIAGTKVAVWAMPDDLALSEFALEVTEAVLPLLNDYFAMPYPYPKLDLIAVPDFAMGAMENWGAIFFRDSRLLVDPKLASTATKRVVANVITHEIVHQWFGNLVTMQWWNDLWLNESFATWLACKIVDQWRPEWLSWQEFQQEKQIPLALDSLRSSRAIVADVASSAEIEAMFDPLTYEKGAAVLRMLEQFLGEAKFRTGIRSYMKTFEFKNTVADDLWRKLEAASDQPVAAIAKDWLTQPGYPTVTARLASGEGPTIELAQRRFDAHGESAPGRWTIPVILHYGGNTRAAHRVLLKDAKTFVEIPTTALKAGPFWLYPNGAEAGFFRVELDNGLDQALRAATPSLEPAERIGLLNHLWAQTQAKAISIERFLDWLLVFRTDGTRVVLEAVASYLDSLAERYARPEDRPALGRLTADLLQSHWDRLGWDPADGENDEPKLSRAAILWPLAVIAQPKDLIDKIVERLDRYLADPGSLDPTLATALLRAGARTGDPKRFDLYLERLRGARTPENRDRYLAALSEFKDPALANRLLRLSLDELRGQDLWKPIRLMLGNTAVQSAAWAFIKENWPALRDKTGPVGAMRIIQGTRALLSQPWLAEVGFFFSDPPNRIESAQKAFEQTLEFLELGLEFKSAQADALSTWLRKQYPT